MLLGQCSIDRKENRGASVLGHTDPWATRTVIPHEHNILFLVLIQCENTDFYFDMSLSNSNPYPPHTRLCCYTSASKHPGIFLSTCKLIRVIWTRFAETHSFILILCLNEHIAVRWRRCWRESWAHLFWRALVTQEEDASVKARALTLTLGECSSRSTTRMRWSHMYTSTECIAHLQCYLE